MLSFITNLYKSSKATILFLKIWDAIASDRIEEAEEYFVSINKIIPELCAEHQIMEAYIKFRASKYGEAKELFDIAWKKIELDARLNSDEKLYLKGYILGPSQLTMRYLKYKNYSYPDYRNIRKFDLRNIDLRKVKKKWKIYFPIMPHPDWDKYGV
ncbi:hypothetical protein [Varunaivibrio sulfuroxidans]|uniref:hypothetical protein n=1 Tax=Varunaivibrio sulfuroxidans TaxID=1773489 RepID=UPI0023E2F9FA|nr:hypothetical protein [Varunaivibrio sulfuroxidans]WES32011.1 hypothetical protein P3M64_06555 [Varunaivibrio sulfuroxidans]